MIITNVGKCNSNSNAAFRFLLFSYLENHGINFILQGRCFLKSGPNESLIQ